MCNIEGHDLGQHLPGTFAFLAAFTAATVRLANLRVQRTDGLVEVDVMDWLLLLRRIEVLG